MIDTIAKVESMVREAGINTTRLVVEREVDGTFCVWSGDANDDTDRDVKVNVKMSTLFAEDGALVEWADEDCSFFWVDFGD